MVSGLLSVIIPSRNEKYLQKTILDLLFKAKEPIEIIAVLDGYWPPIEEIVSKPNVTYIHFSSPKGMRFAINSGVSTAKGEYILKTDAHCMFSKGFDADLKVDCAENWVVVPRRYALDPVNWEIEENPKYPIDYMFLDKNLQGKAWEQKNKSQMLKGFKVDNLMTSQGSAWFMKRSYYDFLELMDEETYGKFYKEFQEIGFKTWLSGGMCKVNKNCFYCHWHKTKDDGRGYNIDKSEDEKAKEAMNNWLRGPQLGWHKQKKSLGWLIEQFSPVPTWI